MPHRPEIILGKADPHSFSQTSSSLAVKFEEIEEAVGHRQPDTPRSRGVTERTGTRGVIPRRGLAFLRTAQGLSIDGLQFNILQYLWRVVTSGNQCFALSNISEWLIPSNQITSSPLVS